MDIAHFLEHPIFRPYHKKLNPGDFLFQQGTMGDTMFIVLEGKARLLSVSKEEECCIAVLGSGEFLGERALVSVDPYRRRFSAQAVTPMVVMELGHSDIINIEKQAPYIKKMILTRSLEVAEERLDSANSLVRVLRPRDIKLRALLLIDFLARSQGMHEQRGTRMFRLAENIAFYADIEKEEIKTLLNDLIERKIIEFDVDGTHLLLSKEELNKTIQLASQENTEKKAA